MIRFDRHELRSIIPVPSGAVAHCSCGADLWAESYSQASALQTDHAVAELHAALDQIVEA